MPFKYEKPCILTAQTPSTAKVQTPAGTSHRVTPAIENIPVGSLTRQYGSPLFVFSERQMRGKYEKISKAFHCRYPNVSFGWSYKTNYLGALCNIFHQQGALAEVVSEMEYDKARAMGLDGDQIIFNGPSKSVASLERAVREGARINIDHLEEMRKIETIADQCGQVVNVGLRINMDTGIQPQWSRFGFNLETGEAKAVVERMVREKKLVLNGLHTHLGTYVQEPGAYARAVIKLLAFARMIDERFGFTIDYLDIGGGFPSESRLKTSYYSPEIGVPDIDEYARSITTALKQHAAPDHLPELILETGRAMVDDAGVLISRVAGSKRMPDGRKAYIADAGINLLYTSNWYKHRIALDRQIPGTCEPSVIFGPLCMNIDVVEESILLPPLSLGTHLIISPVGAYNLTQWMQFITYRPAVVLISPAGEVEMIREPEDLTDIVRREKIPDRLILNAKPKARESAA